MFVEVSIYIPAGFEPTSLHDRYICALDRSATLIRYQVEYL